MGREGLQLPDSRLLCMGHAQCYREDQPGLAVGISCIMLTLSSLVWGEDSNIISGKIHSVFVTHCCFEGFFTLVDRGLSQSFI